MASPLCRAKTLLSGVRRAHSTVDARKVTARTFATRSRVPRQQQQQQPQQQQQHDQPPADRAKESQRELEQEVTKLFAKSLRILSSASTAARTAAVPTPTTTPTTDNKSRGASVPLNSLTIDKETLTRVNEAETRIKQRLVEIANSNEHQMQRLVAKYAGLNKKVAQTAEQNDLWSPDSPFLYRSFLESLTKEYRAQENESLPPAEAEIQQALQEQEAVRMRVEDYLDDQTIREECLLCGDERHDRPLDPMNVPFLLRFLNTAGKILPRSSSGLCKKHQSRVARTIKYARALNIFTYKNSTFSINNPFKPAETLFQPAVLSKFGARMPTPEDLNYDYRRGNRY